MVIWHKLKRFFSLPLHEKGIFIEAIVTLGLMRLAIRVVSLKRLTRHLKYSTDASFEDEVSPQQEETASGIGKLIEYAARHTPWESTCLVQCLTAQRMLKRRGIPGAFYLGVTKGNSVSKDLEAHAWTRYGHEIITGKSGHETFTVLSVFTWKVP